MNRYHRIGMRVVALCALIVGVATLAPVRAAPHIAQATPIELTSTTLVDNSIDGPALWTSNPSGARSGVASVLAWTGTDPGHSLNTMESSDGINYNGKVTYAESSNSRPAVVAIGSPATIVLAWTGTDTNHYLNLLCQGAACGASVGSPKKLVLRPETSGFSPALVHFGSGLLLAWTGTDGGHSLNVLPFSLTTAGSGFRVGSKTTLRQFGSVAGPSLALNPYNAQLLLSWSSNNPPNQLAFATSNDGVMWMDAQRLGETSASGPNGFAVAANNMPTYALTWTGDDLARSVNVQFTSNFPSWPSANNKATLAESALGRPALGYVGTAGQMLLAWTGVDPAHHLNIATLSTNGITLDQRIDAYIASLTTAQQIGQTLMLAVYANSYNAGLDQALTQWHLGSAIVFTNYNGGPIQPGTLAGLQQLTQALQNHASTPLLIATDEEGGTVDRLAFYYGGTPSAQQLAASGNPRVAYGQAQTDAARMRGAGLNVDFAPVADVYQGGGVDQSRTFGNTPGAVSAYAGAFLDGLQQHGVAGTLKHWPGLGAATGNPDYVLPTINSSQAQMNAIDFASFRALLSHRPGMIMVTTVMAPAFDAQNPAMLSPVLVSTVLRGQLGYQGIVVTDALDAQGLIQYMNQQGYADPAQGLAEASVRAFLAGDDIIECPIEQDRMAAVVAAMTQAVQTGRISRTRLQASVHRIIRLKVTMGLMTLP